MLYILFRILILISQNLHRSLIDGASPKPKLWCLLVWSIFSDKYLQASYDTMSCKCHITILKVPLSVFSSNIYFKTHCTCWAIWLVQLLFYPLQDDDVDLINWCCKAFCLYFFRILQMTRVVCLKPFKMFMLQ